MRLIGLTKMFLLFACFLFPVGERAWTQDGSTPPAEVPPAQQTEATSPTRETPNSDPVNQVPPSGRQAITQAATQEVAPVDEANAKPAAKIETVSVESRPIRVFESFNGVLESTRAQEIKAEFKSWTDLVVEEVVEQGAAVSPGKTVVKFKSENLDKAITEAEFALKNAQFELQRTELEMKLANETYELDKAETERTWREAQDEYKYYLDVRLPLRNDDLEYNRKSASYSLEYSKDELDQLEKMYLEDEITEESEAIVLKRAQRSVEASERFFNRSKVNLDREETVEIPREKVAREVALKRAEQAYQRAMIALPIAKEKAEIGFAQAKFAVADKQQKLNELKVDREHMEMKATASGIVYYGRCDRGKWSGRKLDIDQKILPGTVLITIVDPTALMIRGSLDEPNLDSLTPKMRGKAVAPAAGNRLFSVTINSIANISGEDGKYDCEVMIDHLPQGVNLMPGMSCKLSFMIADRNAVVTKKASVFSDDDGVSHFVFVVDGDKVKRNEVVVGKSVGDEIEILEGLTAGTQIAKARQ
jgi:HlyD family secretion protein